MKFTKMHGCGNDYVYINCFEEKAENPAALSKFLSDRHFGIGSDGMILICPSRAADFRMAMYNADGSEGKMCGNGIRCVAKYVYDHGMTDRTDISVETKAGIKHLSLSTEKGRVSQVKVNMGTPVLTARDIPVLSEMKQVIDEPITVLGKEYYMTCVSMGNPHAVVTVEDTRGFQVETVGSIFENNERFPERVNTEFVQVISRSEINMRVWERGTGETLACGTGACASVVACVLNGLIDDEALVHLLGGDLSVFYDREADTVWMTGPAATVFEGDIDIGGAAFEH